MTLAGVVLAAGRGQRLRPLTDLRPKCLCPVDNRALLDLAIDRLSTHLAGGAGPDTLAVNAHHLADQVRAHLAATDGPGLRVHLSEEQPDALGTAGALAQLRDWIAGRDILLTNADAYLPRGVDELLGGWDGRRIRLLVKETGQSSDFGSRRYVGACLLPWSSTRDLEPTPSGLYERLWRSAYERGELELAVTAGLAVDCGTPADYLAANLLASGGQPVVGPGARVAGSIERCVVWPGAVVRSGEHLVDAIRAGTPDRPVTVAAG